MNQLKVNQRKININDKWFFTKEKVDLNGNGNGFKEINLPHTWNAKDGNTGGADYYRGECFYKKVLYIDSNYEGKHIYLEFEAANSVANVYVNGQHVKTHLGGYSTFRVDITNAIQFDNDNIILVSVDNSHIEEVYPLMADFTFFGGLYRDVNIYIVEDVHFDLEDYGSSGVYISQKDVSYERAIVGIEAKVVNHSKSKQEVIWEANILDRCGNRVAGTKHTSVVTLSTSFIEDIIINNPTLWEGIKNPYLYKVISVLRIKDVIIDKREINLGLRFYEVNSQKGFILNSVPTRLNGVSRHQDRAKIGWALSHKDQEEDMELIKEIGANSVRLAHYQHNQYFYDLCDKNGIIVWAEIPFISRNSKTDLTGENAVSQLIELIKQNYNHSAICFWSIQNEITIAGKKNRVEEIVTRLNEIAKKEDPYRLTTQAQVGHHKDNDSMNSITDVVAYNKYYGWYYGICKDFDTWLNEFNKKNPQMSLGISEYGCEGIIEYHSDNPIAKDYTEEYQALYHEKVLQIFNKHSEIWGTYVWNMFDFASDLRDEGGVKGMNNKGLVTYDRKIRKDAFYYYKASWSSEPVLHITSKRFYERVKNTINVKVYSNLNEVELYVNGEYIDRTRGNEHVFIFKNVSLKKGKNYIKVLSDNITDSAVFKKVDCYSVNYNCPKENKELADNWFEKDLKLDLNVKPLEFSKDYLSVKDTIGDIIENPEGEKVIKKYMGQLFDHPMFEMVKAFSIEMLQQFDRAQISDVLIYNINNELNKIKKNK